MVANNILNGIRLMVLSSLLLFSFATPVLAQEGNGPDDSYQMLGAESYGVSIGKKLGRGLANVVTGWVEIPKNIINTSRDSNIGIGATLGLLKGIGQTIGRTLVGAGEVVSFLIPTPDIIHPTYVFEDFYRDTTYGTGAIWQPLGNHGG